MAAAKRKNVQLNTTVSAEMNDALRKYRFANEYDKMGDVLKEAIARLLESEGIAVEDEPADGETVEA